MSSPLHTYIWNHNILVCLTRPISSYATEENVWLQGLWSWSYVASKDVYITMQQRMSPKNLCRLECMKIVTVAWILITPQVITCSHCYVYIYKRIRAQLTSNTLCNSTTPISIALTFCEARALQTVSGVADIDSKRPRGDTTVTHNTTWELSTVQ